MPKRTADFAAWRLEKLANPVNAANYLNAALEDSPDMFLDAFGDVIQAREQVSKIARQAGVTRESLYRSFSASGNPTLDTLCSVLKALQLELKIEAAPATRVARSPRTITGVAAVRETVVRRNARDTSPAVRPPSRRKSA